MQTATDNKISAEYNSNVYNVKISNQGNDWNVNISCKKKINTNTETIKLYIPDVNYNDININVDSAYLTSSIIKSGNIVGNFNMASVLLTLPKGFSGSLDATVISGYFSLVSKDDFNNTNTTIIDDGKIGEVYVPKNFVKNGNTFTNGTQNNVIKVTRKGMGVIGIYSSNYSNSIDIPFDSQNEWKNSWQIGDNNIIANNNKKVIDVVSSGKFKVTAGQGGNQSFKYSKVSQVSFVFSKGQKLKIGVDHISDFHGDNDYTIKLIFKDSKNHLVEVSIGDSEEKEIIFKDAGTYKLTIQNDEDISLWYSFTLQ